MRKEKKKKRSFAERVRLYQRGMGFWWKLSPQWVAAMTCTALLQAVTPYVTLWLSARFIDELTDTRRPEVLVQYAAAAALAGTGLAILSAICSRWSDWQRLNIQWAGFDRRFAQKLCEMDFSRADDPATRAAYDAIMQADNWNSWGFRNLLWRVPGIFTGFFRIVGASALCVSLFTSHVREGGRFAWIDHPLTLPALLAVVLACTLVILWCSRRSMEMMSGFSEDSMMGNRLFAHYGRPPEGSDRGMDVRTYRQDEFIPAKMLSGCLLFSSTGGWATAAKGKLGLMEAAKGALSQSFTGIAYLFVCLKAWAGAFGIGAVTQYVGAITNFAGGLAQMMTAAAELSVNEPYLEKALAFLDMPNEMYQGSLSVEKRRDRNYEVEFRNVSFRYPGSEAWALKNVNFKFRIGQRLAVVGENGSGKTTFIKLLCRLYDPTEGQILLNGIDIRKYDYDQYKDIFSVVFQDFQLLGLPVGQNVAAGIEVDEPAATDCLQKAGLGDWLAKQPKGLGTYLYHDFEEGGVNISGGEAQKIAIARALYKNAAFIILDEPTAALDPIAEAEVYAGFDTLIEDRTAIYISHRLSSCRFCDAIAVFDAGKIVQQGTHESLLEEEGKYAALWNAQAQYYT